ncbi:MAG: NAD(P)H-hydrate dehydratase [Saprospiraceae bacterium]|nr:NAD(P)H-hydrate dehydratase [Saprospiraceae bacterium]
MKIFSTEQIKRWDQYTISEEGIESLALMERASNTFVNWFIHQFPNEDVPIFVFCGNGNNGGDGLAISRLLHQKAYTVTVFIFGETDKRSKDNHANLQAAHKIRDLKIINLSSASDFPTLPESAVIIDALFGTGLKNKLYGLAEELVQYLNQCQGIRVAVDMPSGLLGDCKSTGNVVKADFTFSFEQPKLAFMFPENYKYVGHWIAQSIQLSKQFYSEELTDHYLMTQEYVKSTFKKRQKFEHKGNFGHALLMMGSRGKIGAAVLSASASLRSGCGLTTIYAPACGYDILQTSVPEAMVISDINEDYISNVPELGKPYDAIAIGCGIGLMEETQIAIGKFLKNASQPLVLDADALNIIALNPQMLAWIPKDSILTPHPKEFERLFGPTSDSFERNKLQQEKAIALECYILLKGAHSCIATPEGKCYYNSTGNPGMATAGSGDVLTGIIVGLFAQGYNSEAAICLGTYVHGLSGDLAAREIGETSLIASDLIKYLPSAFKKLNNEEI